MGASFSMPVHSPTNPTLTPQAPELISSEKLRSLPQLEAQAQTRPDGVEARLVNIFSLIDQSRLTDALAQTRELTRDHPNFQLAQLIQGDLLRLRYQPVASLGNVPADLEQAAPNQLAALRAETHKRLAALQERPPQGTVPHQLVALSPRSRHVIAIDASRSRLYLFENAEPANSNSGATSAANLNLIGDFFISVGKAGVDKRLEGDGRTPLGTYYITSMRERKSLPVFYGSGALPINYPNPLDVRRGRTGSGIWLHGTPPDQFVRAPLASDGCVVLSNPDLEQLLSAVAPKTTPVVIADQLQWIDPKALSKERAAFETVVTNWQSARSQPDTIQLQNLLATQPTVISPTMAAQLPNPRNLLVTPPTRLGIWQPSFLRWQDDEETMVVTFEETIDSQPSGVIRRQYWTRENSQWKLFHDSVLEGMSSSQWAAVSPKKPNALRADKAAPPPTPVAKTAPEKTVASSATQTASSEAGEVKSAVLAWAKAWSKKDMGAYLGAYDKTFDPPGKQDRKVWEQDRRDRIVYKSRIEVGLSGLVVKIKGNNATATFVQNYKADQLQVSSRKTLELTQRNGHWRITKEYVGGR